MKSFLISAFMLSFFAVSLIALFFKSYFVFDLFASLLPFWLAICVIFLLSLILLGFILPQLFQSFFIKLTLLTVATAIVTFSLPILNFSTNLISPPKVLASTSLKHTQLKIAAFNKLYSNTNYAEINKKVSEINPDILAITEMKRIDKNHIPALRNYPYYFAKDARDGATISFFSKFPTTESSEFTTSPFVLPLKVTINNIQYDVFAIHPFPPATAQWAKIRDQELQDLSKYIEQMGNQHTIVLGDFNLSPWSKSYQKIFANNSTIKNVALGKGLKFTWHGGIIQTQVDHIFVGKNINVENFESEYVKGSDHNLIWANIIL